MKARAVYEFLEHWETANASENPIFSDLLEEFYGGAYFIFKLEGKEKFVHQLPEIKRAWERYKNAASGDESICLVTGERSRIARLHPIIRGIRGGQAMGNTLVSFNANAYESYGKIKAQGLNAPVSEYAAFAYGTVLNYMLADTSHRMNLGDSTIVFWAESPDSKYYQDAFSLTSNPDELSQKDEQKSYSRDPIAVEDIKSVFRKIASGSKVSRSFSMDENIRFYVLALSPNAARISVRFLLCNRFGYYLNMLIKHYEDLAIEKQLEKDPDSISIWRMLNETVSPSSTDKSASPLLAGSVLRAILTGSSYPAALYHAVMIRIRAEREINYIKSAVIKAYLIRCSNGMKYKKEGVLEMSLNVQSENKAYVLGRLFAALEKSQKDANPTINTTIKDRFFTSACANPALTFPRLIKLSNYHNSKAEYGWSNENKIDEILQLLKVEENPFPKSLSLEDQGIFILGYYHQKNRYYADIKEASELKKDKSKLNDNQMEG